MSRQPGVIGSHGVYSQRCKQGHMIVLLH